MGSKYPWFLEHSQNEHQKQLKLDTEPKVCYSNYTVNVIAKYIPKKKSIQIKGFKESFRGNKKRLKKSHAFSMTLERIEKGGWLKGAVDLNEVNNLEQKKSPRPKWKQQVELVSSKERGLHLVDVKTKDPVKGYSTKLFLEGSKIFVL